MVQLKKTQKSVAHLANNHAILLVQYVQQVSKSSYQGNHVEVTPTRAARYDGHRLVGSVLKIVSHCD